MKYMLDTEFWERGRKHPVELISLGIVSEIGNRFYAVNKEFDWNRVPKDDWLQDNVRPFLVANTFTLKSMEEIKKALTLFFSKDKSPEFWGYYADYDWVVFCQIFGTMLDSLPQFPQMCMDLEQERISWGFSRSIYPERESQEHNALQDALYQMECLKEVQAKKQALVERLTLVPNLDKRR